MSSPIVVFKGSPTGQVVRHNVARYDNTTGRQVAVKVTHSGICGTDEHYKQQDMVLGHEGVGIVEQVGDSVTRFKIGDRVGWGYCHGSCQACAECEKGDQLYCDQRQLYGFTNLSQGSFSSHAVWHEDFLFHIPQQLSMTAAAPLMCAGAAVYSALRAAGARSNTRVGVLGVGGLGHLAIQFAAAMGCRVVALSGSKSKEAEALAFGASEFRGFHTSEDHGSGPDGKLDCLILTGARQPDWSKVIALIRRGGVIVATTVDPEELRAPYIDLVMNAISIRGSLPASPGLHREMLDFAARQNISPLVETFPFTEDGINEAMERLRQGKVRYRGVLAWEDGLAA